MHELWHSYLPLNKEVFQFYAQLTNWAEKQRTANKPYLQKRAVITSASAK